VEYKIKIENTNDGKELKKAKEVTGPGGLPLQPPGGSALIDTPGFPGYALPNAPMPLLGQLPLPQISIPTPRGTQNLRSQKPKTGTVKWYDPAKNYGFIISSEGKEVFVHQSSVQGTPNLLVPGQPVEFDIEIKDNHLRAVNVTGPNGMPIMQPFLQPTPTYGSMDVGGINLSEGGALSNLGKRKAVPNISSSKVARTNGSLSYSDSSLYSTLTSTSNNPYATGFILTPTSSQKTNPYLASMYGSGGYR